MNAVKKRPLRVGDKIRRNSAFDRSAFTIVEDPIQRIKLRRGVHQDYIHDESEQWWLFYDLIEEGPEPKSVQVTDAENEREAALKSAREWMRNMAKPEQDPDWAKRARGLLCSDPGKYPSYSALPAALCDEVERLRSIIANMNVHAGRQPMAIVCQNEEEEP